MAELLNGAEVEELFVGLQNAAQSIFGSRLDLPNFLEHSLTTTTSSERYDFRYSAVDLGAASLNGYFLITEWVPNGNEMQPSEDDIEANYGSELFLVDRTVFGFNLNNREFTRSKSLLKCMFSDEELFESVMEADFSYSRCFDEEDLEVLALDEMVGMDTDHITHSDRSQLSNIFFRHGILL